MTRGRDGFKKREALGHLSFWGSMLGVAYSVACLKNVEVCPSYVYYPLKILSFVVPTLVLRLS